MKTQAAFAGWFVLLGYFLPSASWAENQNVFPLKDPLVTGTFMEYRPGTVRPRFHGGIDLIPKISNQSNNTVRPVAKGKLYYEKRPGNTYRIWIKHPSDAGQYADLVTRYLHIGKYPGASLHGEGVGRDVTKDDTLGTIDTPHDDIGNHLHFEVLADYIPASSRDVPDRANYINPLKYLPRITDDGINHSAEGWTWSILDNAFIEPSYWDTPAVEEDALAEGIPLPPLSFRLLFKGFDRINTIDRYLGFYSIKAWLKRYDSSRDTMTVLEWTFTADEFPANLYNSPHYIFNDRNSVHNVDDDNREDHHSTLSRFFYRLFAHPLSSTGLSIQSQQHTDFCADFPLNLCLDSDGWMAGNISSAHFFMVTVFDFDKDRDDNLGHRVTRRLSIPATAIGDFLHAFTATAGDRQVTLDWTFERPGTSWNHFKIQRSQDSGVSFTDLSTVPYEPIEGEGCLHLSTDPEKPGCNFEYVDETATEDIIYFYRLLTGELVGSSWSTEDTYGPPDWMVRSRPNGGDPVPVPSGPVIFIDKVDVGSFVLYIDSGANYADHYRVEYGPADQDFPLVGTRVSKEQMRKTVSDSNS